MSCVFVAVSLIDQLLASQFCCLSLSLSCVFVTVSVYLSLISVKNQIVERSHNNAIRSHYDSRRPKAVKMVKGAVAQLTRPSVMEVSP